MAVDEHIAYEKLVRRRARKLVREELVDEGIVRDNLDI